MKNTIGIFDSGVGGLTVLQSMIKKLPNEDLIYVGDNANCPYGDKTKEQLLTYATRIVDYFISRGVKIVVLACNTTSANVLDELRKKYPNLKIIGVIDSTVQSFLKNNLKSVLVMATKATIQSNKYAITINMYQKECKVYSLATPKLVPLIESGEYKKGIVNELTNYLKDYKDKVDAVILGCTHYPIVQNQIQSILGDICYVSSSDSVSEEVYYYLQSHHLLGNQKGTVEILTTGNSDEFVYASSSFYNYDNEEVRHLEIKSSK